MSVVELVGIVLLLFFGVFCGFCLFVCFLFFVFLRMRIVGLHSSRLPPSYPGTFAKWLSDYHFKYFIFTFLRINISVLLFSENDDYFNLIKWNENWNFIALWFSSLSPQLLRNTPTQRCTSATGCWNVTLRKEWSQCLGNHRSSCWLRMWRADRRTVSVNFVLWLIWKS